MEYEVVTAQGDDLGEAVDELKRQVESYLREGYKLQSGVSITANADLTKFQVAQALTK